MIRAKGRPCTTASKDCDWNPLWPVQRRSEIQQTFATRPAELGLRGFMKPPSSISNNVFFMYATRFALVLQRACSGVYRKRKRLMRQFKDCRLAAIADPTHGLKKTGIFACPGRLCGSDSTFHGPSEGVLRHPGGFARIETVLQARRAVSFGLECSTAGGWRYSGKRMP